MYRAAALALMLAVSAPAAAFAASSEPKKDNVVESERAIDVMHLVTPVIQNGRLVNYLFVSFRIHLTDRTDVWRMREKGHFLRDALLKASHRAPPVKPGIVDIDSASAVSLFSDAARQVLGASAVKSVEILSVTPLSSPRR